VADGVHLNKLKWFNFEYNSRDFGNFYVIQPNNFSNWPLIHLSIWYTAFRRTSPILWLLSWESSQWCVYVKPVWHDSLRSMVLMLRDSHEVCNLLIYLSTSVVYFNIYLHLYFNLKKLTLSHYFLHSLCFPGGVKNLFLYLYWHYIIKFNFISSVFPIRCQIDICREWTFMVCQTAQRPHLTCIVNVFCILFLLKLRPNTANKL